MFCHLAWEPFKILVVPIGTQRMQAQAGSCWFETSLSRETKKAEKLSAARFPGELSERSPSGLQGLCLREVTSHLGGLGGKRHLIGNKALRLWGDRFRWCWERAGPQEAEPINAGGTEATPLLWLLLQKTCLQGGCFALSAHKNYSK